MAKVATAVGITRLRLEAGPSLMKSVCPVKVKINWRSGDGYRGNQPVPVVFKRGALVSSYIVPFFAISCVLCPGRLHSHRQFDFYLVFNCILLYTHSRE